MNRILFVSFSGPYPPIDGKRQRTAALLQALSGEFEVDFLILGNQVDFDLAMKNNSNHSVRFFFLPFVRNSFEQLLHRIGFVFIPNRYLTHKISVICDKEDYVFAFCRYIHPVSVIPDKIPIVTDIDDDWEEIYQSKLAQASSWYRRFRLQQVIFINTIFYKKLVRRLNLGFVVKPDLRENHLRLLPNLPFQLIQKGRLDFFPSVEPQLLFVGKLSYDPNLSGIKWFIRFVFPLILSEVSHVSLTIVSNVKVDDPELGFLLKKFPSIHLLFNVEDLEKVYQAHSIVVAPILEGAGSNIKIGESLWMGRPVVATSFGTRGYDEEVGNSFLVPCTSPQACSNQIIGWLGNAKRLVKVQLEAYEFAQKKYSLQNWSQSLLTEIGRVR